MSLYNQNIISALKCIIVDDDQAYQSLLAGYISRSVHLELIGSFSSSLDAYSFLIENHEIDIVFIEVDMPHLNGLELSSVIREKTGATAILTSRSRYAMAAFSSVPGTFLLKPFSFENFLAVVPCTDNAVQPGMSYPVREYLWVEDADSGAGKKAFIDQIIAFQSLTEGVVVYFRDIRANARLSIHEVSEIQKRHPNFQQLHLDLVINIDKVVEIKGNDFKMSNGRVFTAGPGFRKTLDRFLRKGLSGLRATG